jgi:hypothetical protein
MKAITMPAELKTALESHGWTERQIARMTWGRRISGSHSHLTIECPVRGIPMYQSGPLTTIQAGDIVAIVRYG